MPKKTEKEENAEQSGENPKPELKKGKNKKETSETEHKETKETTQTQKPERTTSTEEKQENEQKTSTPLLWVLAIATILMIFNQLQIAEINTLFAPTPHISSANNNLQALTTSSSAGAATISLEGDYEILAPALLAQGESPVIANYGTRIKKFPTISGQQKKEPTGDAVQDAVNTLIPTGTPFYGQEAGVSFDDPITALNNWGKLERSTQLNEEQQQRWLKIVNSYTCDYCCGSPQRPTIITRCGCAHAAAWRGIAKWLISKYGDKYEDLQILGEMNRWKTLWYPGPSVQRVLAEQQATGGNTAGAVAGSLDNLPGMVGGC